MSYSKSILLFFLLTSSSINATSQSKKQLRTFKRIYDCVLADYFDNTPLPKPFNVMVVNELEDKYLHTPRYDIYEDILATKLSIPVNDSLWTSFIKEALDIKTYQDYPLPKLENQPAISFTHVSHDSVTSVFERGGFEGEFYRVFGSGTVGYVQFSPVLLSRNGRRAIVALNHTLGNNDVMGVLYLLEKSHNGKWQVVGQNTIWLG